MNKVRSLRVEGEQYDSNTYKITSRAVGTQQWVADRWAEGCLPANSKSETTKLRSSTGNFQGIHRADGSGLLKHYNHIECIRTRSGLIISDTSCWARGFAHCDTPRHTDYRFDVTTLNARLRGEDESIYGITEVDDSSEKPVITFETGRVYDFGAKSWDREASGELESVVLGQ